MMISQKVESCTRMAKHKSSIYKAWWCRESGTVHMVREHFATRRNAVDRTFCDATKIEPEE
jgi:hypothetical protein